MNHESIPSEAKPEKLVEDKRLRWFEVFLVVLVAVGGSFINAIYFLKNGPPADPSEADSTGWLFRIVHEITALLVLVYVLFRRGRRFRDLGLRWSFRDAGVGLGVAVVSYLSYALGHKLLEALHYGIYRSAIVERAASDFFRHPPLTAIPFVFLNPFFEELIVRAYVMSEVRDLTGSAALAVIFSVAIQTSSSVRVPDSEDPIAA